MSVRNGGPVSPIVVPIHGKDRPIRFPVNAFKEFEREFGYSVVSALRKGADMQITDLMAVLHVGVKHGANGAYVPDRDKFTEWVEADIEAERLHPTRIAQEVVAAVKASTMYREAPTRDEPEAEEDAADPS